MTAVTLEITEKQSKAGKTSLSIKPREFLRKGEFALVEKVKYATAMESKMFPGTYSALVLHDGKEVYLNLKKEEAEQFDALGGLGDTLKIEVYDKKYFFQGEKTTKRMKFTLVEPQE